MVLLVTYNEFYTFIIVLISDIYYNGFKLDF